MKMETPIAARPPSTWMDSLKRALVPAQWTLARITARELRSGEPELHLLPQLVDPSRAAFDIGANRGIWANVMARYCETVWAFEPNPKMFDLLSRGSRPSVLCRKEALSDADGEIEFLIPGEGQHFSSQGGSLSPVKIGDRPHMRVPVERARLDDLDSPPVGFMKIDVEGHESAVLEGARETISRDRPVMIIEIEERHTGQSIEDALDYVEDFGYRAKILKNGHLVNRSEFDPDSDHRDAIGSSAYINNFVFLPLG
jgi:FkbM family methyltransferase